MRFLVAGPILLSAAFAGCRSLPPAVPTKPPVPMTLFRADNDDLPEVVAALNTRLEGTYPQGPTVHYAAVTLEEAQLAVGCAESTPECWSAIADPIPTAALLVAEVTPEGTNGVRISLRLFDAAGQKTLRSAERVYESSAAATRGVVEVVNLISAAGGAP